MLMHHDDGDGDGTGECEETTGPSNCDSTMKPHQESGFRKGFLLGAAKSRRRRRSLDRHEERLVVVGPNNNKRDVDGDDDEEEARLLMASRRSSEEPPPLGDNQALPLLVPPNRNAAVLVRLVQVLNDGDGNRNDSSSTPRDREPKSSIQQEHDCSPVNSTTPIGGVVDSRSRSAGGVCHEGSAGSIGAVAKPAEASGFVRFHALWRQAHRAAVTALSDRSPTNGSRIRRGDDNVGVQTQQSSRCILSDFLERHVRTVEQWGWCWQLACGDPPPPSTQRRPSRKRLVTHALLSEMLRSPSGIRSLRDCLTARDADSRAWTLHCLAWLDDGLFHQEDELLRRGPEQEYLAKVLVVHVLPILVEIVETEATRTVLAQCSLDCAVGMVASLCDPLVQIQDGVDGGSDIDGAMSSLCAESKEWSDVQNVLYDVIPLFNRLWDVHLSWLESSKLSDTFEKVQNRCRRSVLLAWKASASSVAKRSWCREVCGCFGPSALPDSPSRCLGFGGLAQTVGSRDRSLSEPTVVAILIAVDRDGDADSKRIVLRGLLGWLGQRRKNLERLSRTAIASVLPIVHRWASNLDAPCEATVLVTAIEALWVCGLGLVPSEVGADKAALADALRESFHSSVAWMASSKTPIVQRLVALVGNLLILQNDASLLRSLTTQPESVAVEVLLYTIRAFTIPDLGATNALRDDATMLLLSKLGHWPSVYDSMKEDPKLFNASNPIEVTCLLTDLALEQRVEDSMLPVVVDALLCVLCEQSSLPGGCCSCVSIMVECLVRCEEAPAIERPQRKSSFGQFCDVLGPRWRRSILGTDALPLVLVNLAEMVLQYPSKLAPLSLFGSVVGISSDYDKVDCHQGTLASATKGMGKLAFQTMSRRFAPCATSPNDQAIQRLSPLLLLRRIPRCYYASLQDFSRVTPRDDVHDDVHNLYMNVAKEVAILIGVEASTESYTADERRLAAEVGALLLPAENLHRWVIFPSYISLTDALESPEACEARLVPKIRAFRAALYSGCHVIPFAVNASDGNVLRKIASCSLSLLRREIPRTDGGDCHEELYRLEAGCTDFLALCIQRLFEVDSRNCPALDALGLQYESLVAIALTGKDDVVVNNLVDVHERERATVQYSMLARACVWNSLLLVAKRCQVEHGHLNRFSAAFVPCTIEWGISIPTDKSARHPLRVAAAFQILLTLFVRSASSEWNIVASMDDSLLDKLISWSLSVASSRSDSAAAREARMTAVKLLLSLLASGAVTAYDPNRPVPDQRILEILSLVGSIAEHDPDADLQKLAVASMQVLKGDGTSTDAIVLTGTR